MKNLKIIGVIVTIAGALISVAETVINDKKMKDTIVEEVAKATANKK